MSRLRIAVFHDLPSGGAKRSLHQQVSGLAALGHHIDVFVPSTADEGFLPLDGVAHSIERFLRPASPSRERALESRAPLFAGMQWIRYLALVRGSEREIAKAIDAGSYDVALVQANQFTQSPWLLRFLHTPAVYYCQEPLRAAYEPRIAPLATRLALRATVGRIDRRNARAAKRILVNSRFSQQRVNRAYGLATEVNYLGVDVSSFQPSRATPDDYILTVAALHPLKGIRFLVEALGRITPLQRPPFIVVSDRSRSAERARLERQAAALDVDLQFRFRVSESELVDLYSRARLVVYAPHDEPFGFVPLEAMACGRPVLGVREGGIPETIVEGETGFLAERDPADFARRLEELLIDSDRAEQVGAQAAQIVRTRWTWEQSVRELAKHCEEIAKFDS